MVTHGQCLNCAEPVLTRITRPVYWGSDDGFRDDVDVGVVNMESMALEVQCSSYGRDN